MIKERVIDDNSKLKKRSTSLLKSRVNDLEQEAVPTIKDGSAKNILIVGIRVNGNSKKDVKINSIIEGHIPDENKNIIIISFLGM